MTSAGVVFAPSVGLKSQGGGVDGPRRRAPVAGIGGAHIGYLAVLTADHDGSAVTRLRALTCPRQRARAVTIRGRETKAAGLDSPAPDARAPTFTK
jgi:hypothetical protein